MGHLLDAESALLQSQRGEWLRMQADNLPLLAVTLAAPSSDEVVAEIPVQLYGTEADLDASQALVSELREPPGFFVSKRSRWNFGNRVPGLVVPPSPEPAH